MPIFPARYPDPRRRVPVHHPQPPGGPVADPRAVVTGTSFEAPYVPETAAVVDRAALVMTRVWLEWARRLTGVILAVQTEINTFPGLSSGSLAEQPTGLGPDDKGLLYYVDAPYGHCCRWTGAVWEFTPGDPGNGFFAPRAFAPQENFWTECNGAATDYLRVGGATLDVQGFTTPNLVGAASYFKSASAYDGIVLPPTGAPVTGTPGLSGAPGVAGSTAAGGTHGHTGSTNATGGHTHPGSGTNATGAHSHGGNTGATGVHAHGISTFGVNYDSGGSTVQVPVAGTLDAGNHQHAIGEDGFHSHSVGLVNDGHHAHDVSTSLAPDHTHGSGTLAGTLGTLAANAGTLAAGASDPQHLNVRIYFRR